MLKPLMPQAIKFILEESNHFDWELWETGMLRLDLAPDLTLHVWDMRFRNEAVTLIHDHPWGFQSTVVNGRLRNQRYSLGINTNPLTPADRAPYSQQLLICGADACKLEAPVPVWLIEQPLQIIGAGESYTQDSNEIHETDADNGTVTLVRRAFGEGPRDRANVYVPSGCEFVSAEPRKATSDEVGSIIDHALSLWPNAN
jgi:hypothetical protein